MMDLGLRHTVIPFLAAAIPRRSEAQAFAAAGVPGTGSFFPPARLPFGAFPAGATTCVYACSTTTATS